jgi:cellulose synthase/poly-beta-1,6-N-acetylglucosamine synthase-like glycosyltransferase/peptidoglycan/xylan/chitin deacetylase (PgdA/CDA1 family)
VHWFVLGVLVAALLLMLFAEGISTRTTGRSGTPIGGPGNAPLAGAPAVLGADGHGGLRGRQRPAARRIALTFDDGPDPRWTPRIAAVLRQLHVPATFFVVGSHVAQHPDIVRSLHEQGFEIGQHTFSHADLGKEPGWARRVQMALTESSIVGATGIRSRTIRPPYSATAASVTRRQARALGDVARRGYLVALSDIDSRDWTQPGVDEIVQRSTPRGNAGGVVLMHDGGGNRTETVAALRRVVPRLRARGFRFVTVAQMAGLPRGVVERPAGVVDRITGRLLIGALRLARTVRDALSALLVAALVLTVLRLIAVLALARRHARGSRGRTRDPSFAPPVSVIVPAYNEGVTVARTVRSIVDSDYPDLEVVVVDDGSEDDTAAAVEALGLPGVRVLRQPNAGKPAALNRGLRATRREIVVMADADTVFEPESMRRLVQAFADPGVGAVSGNTKVGNRTGLLGRWQHIEYVLAFNLDRRLYEVLGCIPTVPGAIGAFRRSALASSGLSSATLAEDTDLTLAISRAGWRVVYADDARGWTEAPSTLSALWRQRYRWSYGTMQAVWKHRASLWRDGERHVGRRALPYLVLFQVALPMLGPVVDLFALYGLLFLDPVAVAVVWLAFTALQLAVAVYAFRLDREPLRPLWALPLQQFVYRQLMYVVVLQSLVSALLGTRLHWQHIERTGEAQAGPGNAQRGGRARAASPSA